MEIAIRSCYVCVTDMVRAIRFYEALLERPVKERDETYSVFEVGGFRLGCSPSALPGRSAHMEQTACPAWSCRAALPLCGSWPGRGWCFRCGA